MQTAFFFSCVFPPPAAGPEIFTRPYCACTRGASYAYKTAVVQRIVRHIIIVDVFFYLFGCPVQDGIVLDDLVGFIPLNYAEIVAVGRMFGP